MPVPPTRGQHETLRPPLPLAFDRMSQSMDKNGQTHPLEADEKTRLLRLALRDTISGQATNCFAISVSAGEYGRAQLSKASSRTSRQAIAVERDSNAHSKTRIRGIGRGVSIWVRERAFEPSL